MSFKVPNQFRLRTGIMGSSDDIGLCGVFHVPIIKNKSGEVLVTEKVHILKGSLLSCIACDGTSKTPFPKWEHVSCYKIHKNARYIPSWNDMCIVKSLFWDEEDCVLQYHPPKSEYVNTNPYVLHLWKPLDFEIPTPNKLLI